MYGSSALYNLGLIVAVTGLACLIYGLVVILDYFDAYGPALYPNHSQTRKRMLALSAVGLVAGILGELMMWLS